MAENTDYWDRVVALNTRAYEDFFRNEKVLLEKVSGGPLLDVCCGSGRAFELIPSSMTHTVIGLDANVHAIHSAQRRYTSNAFVVADALSMPFRNSTFYCCYCLASLVNFGNHKADLLKEMARVTKSRGGILLSVYNEDALQERLRAYVGAEIPIQKVDGHGCVYFNFEGADNISEQFTRHDLEKLAKRTGLDVEEIKKEGIGYFCKFSKK